MSKYLCRLKTLVAHVQTEADGDELFLKIDGRKIWPSDNRFIRFDNKQSVEVNHLCNLDILGGFLDIELWEYDNILFSSCIGEFVLSLDEAGGPYYSDLKPSNGSKARYSLIWEVVKVSEVLEKRIVDSPKASNYSIKSS
jgi:hypothetical protein